MDTTLFSLVLSPQTLGPLTETLVRTVSDDITELPKLQSFCSRFLPQLDIISYEADGRKTGNCPGTLQEKV